ncbi:MAG: LacI family DNA-binding transcriptional regulator [Anaerolineales bacterium]|nr:LacI family DNA-binding transcriptional regulator [Anaerolineales bacterium]
MSVEENPTIYSVASEAEVSISTVSRVLNTPHLVTPETRKKVLSAIEKLGYTPKAAAQAHAQKAFGRVGVLTPFFRHPSFVQRMRGIASVLAVNSYELVIYPVESFEQIYHYLDTVRINRRLDGLITMALPIDETTVKRFHNRSFPVVMIESDHPEMNSILVDNVEGGRLAAKYLIGKRHTQFGFIGDGDLPDYSLRPSDARLKGFAEVLEASDLLLLPEHIIFPAPYKVHDEVKKLLDTPNRPTAIFAASDELAMQVLMIARRKGLNIPGDLAVIGFDDLDFAGHIGLTTINQQLDESGRIAAEMLMKMVRGENSKVQTIKLSLSIVERDTT